MWRAKAAGLPVTCDVTPHHLALADEWIAGARRWSWEALGPDGNPATHGRTACSDAPPYNTALRVNPPLGTPADAAACLAALLDGTADAVATDHAPHTVVDKEVEFGRAANGISGIETALGVLLALVDAGRLPLARAIAALTVGPPGVVASWPGLASAPAARGRGLTEGAPADLVVFDRADRWRVTPKRFVEGQELAAPGPRAVRPRASHDRRWTPGLRGPRGRLDRELRASDVGPRRARIAVRAGEPECDRP